MCVSREKAVVVTTVLASSRCCDVVCQHRRRKDRDTNVQLVFPSVHRTSVRSKTVRLSSVRRTQQQNETQLTKYKRCILII